MRFLLAALLCVACCGCQSPTAVRILAYNIKHGEGMDGVVDLERAAAVIRAVDPDVVTLQEIDRGTRRTKRVDQAKELGARTGMHHAFGRFMDYQGGEYGMAVLSKHPILAVANHRLPDGAEPRSALAIRTRVGDGPELAVVGIHFYRTKDERLAQAERLIEVLDESLPDDAIVVLAGDFNSRPGGAVMTRLGERFHAVPKDGNAFTFPSDQPDREIDHFLVRPRRRFLSLRARVLEESVASDHRPLVLDVRVR